ncbi:MAG: mono/diheme cytochrome c family protein [Candidatus Aldehydirespiratoraceae bacterium]|jgi:mono/diheme cytochrome c family protein
MIGLTTTSIAGVAFAVILVAFIVYSLFNVRAGRAEIGSEIELAANRKKYYDDEILEGSRLERVQLLGLGLLLISVIGLPFYWILEPARQAGAQEGWDKRFASWGSELFEPTAEGGFNCAGCHGGMNAVGGEAPFTVTDPVTGAVEAVNWKAPALNTVLYKFDESEIEFILNYGRPFSPMSPWGTVGGGPMTSQNIETLIEYLKSIQIPREGCLEDELGGEEYYDVELCSSGILPADDRADIELAARQAMEADDITYGEALFNLELGAGAYSCARCHTLGWSYGDPGVTGQGAYGWNLTAGSTNSHFATEDDMVNFLKNGSEFGKQYGLNAQGSGRMPGFGSVLTDEQIRAVVEYVRSL